MSDNQQIKETDTATQKKVREIPPLSFGKNETAIVKGVAILCMLYHHLFNIPELNIGVTYFYFPIVQRLCWFGEICVGLFSFLSGYGIFHTMEKGFTESLGKSLKNQYPQALRRILNLYLKLWLVMIPYIILQYFTAGLRLTWIELLGNATTLVNTLNGTWWFVFQYVQMLLIAPVLAMVFHHFPDKKQTFLKWGILIGCALLYKGCGAWLRASFPDFYSFAKERIHPAFLLCYFSGYLLARYHLIESFLVWVEKITGGKLIPQAILGTCFLMLTLILRVLYATGPMAPTYDFFFTPCLTLGMILFSRGIGWLRASLSHLGKCSTYMWFLHIFTYAYTKEWIGLYLSSHIAFYIFQVILAMLVSMIFLWVDHSISTALHKSR